MLLSMRATGRPLPLFRLILRGIAALAAMRLEGRGGPDRYYCRYFAAAASRAW
jgi:hypothetical protein